MVDYTETIEVYDIKVSMDNEYMKIYMYVYWISVERYHWSAGLKYQIP